jgi:DNA modification methylase
MHKLLKPTGSFYYHCDDTIGHYVRAILDYIFGINNFRNVITWQRTGAKGNTKKNYPRNSDFIFFYTKTDNYTFNVQYREYAEGGLNFYRYKDEKGRLYGLDNVTAPGSKNGVREWNIDGKIIRHPDGRGFRWTQETLDRKRKEHFEKYGTEFIVISKNGVPRQVRYLEEGKGAVVDNIWADINCIQSHAKERLGYPTQKPEALLERIILASSNPGDKVADFYLGGGTTAAVAVKTGREFLGCDINLRAIQITQKRLESLGMQWGKDLIVKGVPFRSKELKEYLAYVAENSKKKNVEKFELEAITVKYYLKNVVGNEKKVGDKGVDGTFSFKYQGKNRKGIVQVTSSVNTNHFKAFCGEISRNTADLGVYICFKDQVNDNMRKFAKECGKIGNVDRLQILTFEDLLDHKQYFSLPSEDLVFS